jgi:hypothetical protein
MGIGPMELALVLVWILPLVAFVFLVLLALRLVRAVERLAVAAEALAHRREGPMA